MLNVTMKRTIQIVQSLKNLTCTPGWCSQNVSEIEIVLDGKKFGRMFEIIPTSNTYGVCYLSKASQKCILVKHTFALGKNLHTTPWISLLCPSMYTDGKTLKFFDISFLTKL